MHTLLLRVRESFWAAPALTGVGAVVLAEVLVLLDRHVIATGTALGFLDALSASGGRSILTTIGTSMLTVAGTSFSITISVLATTSSTYGPRLVRNFMADRANQFVLAAFTATFLYTMVVLRSVHSAVDDGDAFVPVIAIHVAVLLGVVDVGVLVFFIHHIASSTQITSLQQQVQADLEAVVAEAYRPRPDGGTPDGARTDALPPAPADGVRTDPVPATDPRPGDVVVRAHGSGYVQSVQWGRLVAWAAGHDARIDVEAMPGTYVIAGDPLLRVSAPGPVVELLGRTRLGGVLPAAVVLGPARTPHQDVAFALQQLVEIAVRGLASGSNDPYTAVSALDLAATALVPLWRHREPVTAYCDDDGQPRVTPHWPAPEELVGSVFVAVETYGTEHPAVVAAAVRLAQRLESVASGSRRGRAATMVRRLRDQAS